MNQSQCNTEIGVNTLKRVIEYLSSALPIDEQSQQDALTLANERIEELFALIAKPDQTVCPFCNSILAVDSGGYLPAHIGVDNKPCINARS